MELTATKLQSELCQIQIAQLIPHPNNPRLFLREDVVEAIAAQLRDGRFDPCYAILVRPLDEGGYQILSGHHRVEAAKRVGLLEIPTWVRPMDPEQGFLELVRSNNQGELKPLEVGLHALAYTQSRGQLTAYAAAIGKAIATVSELRSAAEVFLRTREQIEDPSRLFDRARHLYQISKADPEDWPLLVVHMVDEGWSAIETEKAVKTVMAVCSIPNWLQPVFPADEYKLKAIGDDRTIRDLELWVQTACDRYSELPAKREVKIPNGDEYRVEYLDCRALFVEQLMLMKNQSATRIDKAARTVLDGVAEADRIFEEWEASRADEKELRKSEEAKAHALLCLKQEYAPLGYYGDVKQVLPGLEPESFDLVLTDPPYLLSNGGVSCRSGQYAEVDKNFVDADGQAIAPDEWVPLVAPLLKPGGTLALTCTHHIDLAVRLAAEQAGLEFEQALAWVKRSAPPRLTPNGHQDCFESVLVFIKPGAAPYFAYDLLSQKYWGGVQPKSVLEFEQCSGSERLGWHDTQKPLALIRYLLDAYCPPDGYVLDPFAGSGTTAIAAKSGGYHCNWVEVDMDFFNKAQSRIEQAPFNWEKRDQDA